MAKQRRPSKSVKGNESVPGSAVPGARVAHQAAQPPTSSQPAVRRSTYVEAVGVYEHGLEALQRHDYRGATELFETVLRKYSEEKELHERVRLYLSICQRQLSRAEPAPRTIEERLFASTIAINGGRYDEALSQLHLVRDEDPDNDHALYMLAVAHAQRGDLVEAVAHLLRAIAVNPENRSLAKHDPDFEPLRADETFRSAVDSARLARGERHRSVRTRTGDRR
ncbi:MAG: tetratricopeptide repeat protein [Acidobacteriota bacterium]